MLLLQHGNSEITSDIVTVAALCFCTEIENSEEPNNLPEFEKQEIYSSRLHLWESDENSMEKLANQTELNVNGTIQGAQETVNKTHKFVQCLLKMGNSLVQLTNDTELIKLLQPDPKVTDRDIPGLCVLVLFLFKVLSIFNSSSFTRAVIAYWRRELLCILGDEKTLVRKMQNLIDDDEVDGSFEDKEEDIAIPIIDISAHLQNPWTSDK
ncbi:hypothetical protein NQ314_007442 [Rhamnusium bicolor]|uniref:Uncharacterized protein n=1 Tax=Rhamnusium bicolor TaxID=1586634 RepID=A0AAV8YNV3_9CUCU|nr:hypothetical protein NQ314_007442 [Rhamnusium bicolor]